MAEQTSSVRCTGCGRPFAPVPVVDLDEPRPTLAVVPRQDATQPARQRGVVLTMRLTPLEGGTSD